MSLIHVSRSWDAFGGNIPRSLYVRFWRFHFTFRMEVDYKPSKPLSALPESRRRDWRDK